MVYVRKDKDDRFRQMRQSIYVYIHIVWIGHVVILFVLLLFIVPLSRENFSIWRPLPLPGFIFRPILGGLAVSVH